MIVYEMSSALPFALHRLDLARTGRFLSRRLKIRRITIGVRFVSKKEIQRLNHIYRHNDRPTDVLSFSSLLPSTLYLLPSTHLGDLAICPSFAKTEAARRSASLREELIRLLAHGTLHLAGFDHATKKGEARMFKLQEEAVEAIMKHKT